MKIYNMIVVTVPTNKKVIRKDLTDHVFETKTAK
jgi:preprotein translocase subunit SecA